MATLDSVLNVAIPLAAVMFFGWVCLINPLRRAGLFEVLGKGIVWFQERYGINKKGDDFELPQEIVWEE